MQRFMSSRNVAVSVMVTMVTVLRQRYFGRCTEPLREAHEEGSEEYARPWHWIAVGSQEERLPFGCLLPQDDVRSSDALSRAGAKACRQGTTGIRRRFGEGGEVGYFLLLGLRVRGVLVSSSPFPSLARLNSRRPWPSPLAISGSFSPPKKNRGNKENEQ